MTSPVKQLGVIDNLDSPSCVGQPSQTDILGLASLHPCTGFTQFGKTLSDHPRLEESNTVCHGNSTLYASSLAAGGAGHQRIGLSERNERLVEQ